MLCCKCLHRPSEWYYCKSNDLLSVSTTTFVLSRRTNDWLLADLTCNNFCTNWSCSCSLETTCPRWKTHSEKLRNLVLKVAWIFNEQPAKFYCYQMCRFWGSALFYSYYFASCSRKNLISSNYTLQIQLINQSPNSCYNYFSIPFTLFCL